MEGESRFGAFVVVQRFASQAVAAAAGCEVVERSAQAVATEEPFERLAGATSVLPLACDGESGQLRLDQSGGLERLFVAASRRGLAPVSSEVPGQPELVSVEPAFVAEPPQ